MNIFVTGLGCISPLGINFNQNIQQLRAEVDGLDRSMFLESKYQKLKYFGEVKFSTSYLTNHFLLNEINGLTRTDVLAFGAFKEAVDSAGLSLKDISSSTTAFISASTVGGMCLTDELFRDANLKVVRSKYIHSYNCAAHTLKIAKAYKLKGVTNTINTACSSSANAIMMGMKLIRTGRADRVIVGGVDSLAKYTVNGFNALQILSDQKCTPFDESREGLNLGEAAAYLVLESEKVAKEKVKYARIMGAGNTNDAFHTSSMSDTAEGITRCIKEAMVDSNIKAGEVDYINAHGTGTKNNDIVELTGFINVFQDLPRYSSTKSYTGHTLGAAGSLEAIYSISSMMFSELYPSLRVDRPIDDSNALVLDYKKEVDVNTVMSNSYGFGGNCTSLIFRKV